MLARLLPRLRPAAEHRPAAALLSPREREVLELLAAGASNQAIAGSLSVTVNTVRNHVQSVLTKLGAHSKLEAVSLGVREGIIAFPST
jgi:DNA-binding NarL/FixJ family response regulator